jgi:ATP-dependent Clp protease adaptor protein ClpS
MEFVINVLITIFRKDPQTAKDITIEVHEKGRGIAGTYSYEVAEQKCMETITQARSNTYPLDVIIEEE